MARFMAGRYGTDKLNMTILGIGVAVCLVSMFIRVPIVNLILTIISYVLLIWALFRSFSRNTYKRYQENRRFLQFFDRLKDREHKYFNCPRCRQPVRVPRGKGKIAITCPKCKERFVRKS
ncbi:MAG: hypothetical protein IJX67_11150 [Oscillospiraceae bacterium]|nr:hypothetical protein [Oscillospiraceae bacterium]